MGLATARQVREEFNRDIQEVYDLRCVEMKEVGGGERNMMSLICCWLFGDLIFISSSRLKLKLMPRYPFYVQGFTYIACAGTSNRVSSTRASFSPGRMATAVC